jgi:DNA-binding CsgD family transcriptional regulator/predicted DNA-binding transcriptional regulator
MTLRDLGLSDDQERVYRSLIECPDATVEDLRALGLSARSLRVALAELVQLGLVQEAPDQPSRVQVPNVLAALGSLIEETEDRLTQQLRRVAGTRDLALALTTRQAVRRAPASNVLSNGIGVEHMPGAYHSLEELGFFARETVVATRPGCPQSAEELDAVRLLDERNLRRGLVVRIIYEELVLRDDLNREYLRFLSTRGARLRVSAPPFERMLILDSSVAVLPLEPGHSSRGALLVREPVLVAGLVRLFESRWSESGVLPEGEDLDEGSITDNDRKTLHLLARGVTDEVTARELGISVRHLRRRIARLTERLEASSRFEAGAKAARRGWI